MLAGHNVTSNFSVYLSTGPVSAEERGDRRVNPVLLTFAVLCENRIMDKISCTVKADSRYKEELTTGRILTDHLTAEQELTRLRFSVLLDTRVRQGRGNLCGTQVQREMRRSWPQEPRFKFFLFVVAQ
jgi:hypothetical protein